MLATAFKEWAAVCQALATGRQALILRKGGIAETDGSFRPEHPRFWLYPTVFHEHRDGLKPDDQWLHNSALAERAPAGFVRLSLYAETVAVHRVSDWASIEALNDLHVWSPVAVQQKFEYRTPGLYVLAVRIFQASHAVELSESPEFAGCKTWVDLGRPLAEHGRPVLDDASFAQLLLSLSSRLSSTTF